MVLTHTQIVAAFNEWMRRYIADPAGFDAEFQTLAQFVAEQSDGRTPSYGETCAAMFLSLFPAEAVSSNDQSAA